ncbi:MAG: DinB family protein [Pyrinomonadaceae bacterium]
MTTELPPADEQVGRAFLAHARFLLTADYLPRIERCLAVLAPADVWWRAAPNSNSVGHLLQHLAGNARQWVVAGVGCTPDMRQRDEEFAAPTAARPTASELLAHLRATLAEVDSMLVSLAPATLLETRTIQGLKDVTVLTAVFHVVEHFSMHTGQIILLTKLRTGRDLAFYDFAGDVPRTTWNEQK